MRGILKYDRFCKRYKRLPNSTLHSCISWGLVFHFKDQVAILYSSNIRDISNQSLIRVDYQADDCFSYFIIDHKLCTMCAIGS